MKTPFMIFSKIFQYLKTKFLLLLFLIPPLSFSQTLCEKSFAVLGTGVHTGQPHKKVSETYKHLEQIGFWKTIHPQHKNLGHSSYKTVKSYQSLFNKISNILKQGMRPALIGGDHSQSFATVSALLNAYPNLKVIWIDAHADINIPETSPSGNIHGMPVAGLTGLADKTQWEMPWLNQHLPFENLVYLGIRDVDFGEREFIEKHNIENYSVQDIRKKGLKKILSDISKDWKDNHPVHLSFDVDALDPSLIPATGTPVARGINLKEAKAIITWAKKLNLVSFEVVEFNHELAKNKKELKVSEKNVKIIIEDLLEP